MFGPPADLTPIEDPGVERHEDTCICEGAGHLWEESTEDGVYRIWPVACPGRNEDEW